MTTAPDDDFPPDPDWPYTPDEGPAEVEVPAGHWPDVGDTITLTDDEIEEAAALARLRTEQAKLKRESDAIRGRLLAKLRNAKAVRAVDSGGKPIVRLRVQHPERVNAHKLEALYPDVYREVIGTGETIIVDVI